MRSFNSIARKVIELREAKNLTQEQLAQQANVSIEELQKIEKGDPNFVIMELFKISEILKFNPAKIFADCEKTNKRRISSIKKLLLISTEENLIEFETFIKAKLKIK